MGLDSKTGHADRDWRDDFDSLEVYNGATPPIARAWSGCSTTGCSLLELGHSYVATGDSDSHRIQYQWAGYPRTYVSLPPDQAGDTGPIDKALIASLKAGHAFVTSGPMISAKIGGQGPGSTVSASDGPLKLRVSVRAAPWIDVNEIEVLRGGVTLARMSVPSRRG